MTMPVALPAPRRALRMVQRNLIVYKHGWLIIFTGFFEPLLYLLGVGLGVGAMVGEMEGVSYRAFIMPGLLASSCMNGAITDGFFNIFFKLHFQKTYDGILATPMRVPDVAFGEMLWAMSRGSIYAIGFVGFVLAMGHVTGAPMMLSRTGLLAIPASMFISAVLSSGALCLTSIVRKVQDFDLVMGLIVTPMFLFSGTFFSVAALPRPVQWIVEATPLFHAVALLRQLTTGAIHPSIAWHVAYLVTLGVVSFLIAMHRLERALVK